MPGRKLMFLFYVETVSEIIIRMASTREVLIFTCIISFDLESLKVGRVSFSPTDIRAQEKTSKQRKLGSLRNIF